MSGCSPCGQDDRAFLCWRVHQHYIVAFLEGLAAVFKELQYSILNLDVHPAALSFLALSVPFLPLALPLFLFAVTPLSSLQQLFVSRQNVDAEIALQSRCRVWRWRRGPKEVRRRKA